MIDKDSSLDEICFVVAHALRISELTELAEEIERLRVLLGFAEPFALAERFDHYCALRGANVPGEPKLAKQFLAEIA
ncbi:MAG: hypothetical protein ACYDGW_10760 [Vulcanimicrobiaceae bacterium]